MKSLSLMLLSISLYLNSNAQALAIQDELIHLLQEFQTEQILPPDVQLSGIEVRDSQLVVNLNLPQAFLTTAFDELTYDALQEAINAVASNHHYSGIILQYVNSNELPLLLSDWLPEVALVMPEPQVNKDPVPPIENHSPARPVCEDAAQPGGQLSGKTIWLSAGHGWNYDARNSCFRTQRQNYYGMVEDFATVEIVNYHLLHYLYQAGANVWTVRERDMNENEVVVTTRSKSGQYKEEGKWKTSKSKGFRGQGYRYSISRSGESAAAVFRPQIPEAGKYWVSAYYVAGANRSADTRYRILHAGGESTVSIDQEVHGDTWVYLGQFYFNKGNEGAVVLTNASSETNQAVIADAIRFGSGYGDRPDCQSGEVSGEPRFEEGARYFAGFQGYPNCVNDVLIRPLYAEWELAKAKRNEQNNAVYVSVHSNAHGTGGTESYVHNSRPVRGSWSLQKYIHESLIRDIRSAWQADWKDRGRKKADFGELRGLRTMPGILVELAFHDHADDARALGSPRFRQIAARAIYKGVATYFARKEGRQPIFLPEPPTHLSARSTPNGAVHISWQAPPTAKANGHAASAYKVYIGEHGKAFGKGIITKDPFLILSDIQAGKTYYIRVTALNEGGESFPTAIVAVRPPPADEPKFLIVDGFDRLDRTLAPIVQEQVPAHAPLGAVRRVFLEQMNHYDYMYEHASALEMNNIYFDGASNEAVSDSKVLLKDYALVYWYLGRESSRDNTLTAGEQRELKRYLDMGGRLLLSGSEIAYDLDKKGGGSTFCHQYLKCSFAGDDAGSATLVSKRNDPLGAYEAELQATGYGSYALQSADYFKVADNGRELLWYDNGKVAAVGWKGHFGVLTFGFPLETISSLADRANLIKNSIRFLQDTEVEHQIAVIPHAFGEELRIDLHNAPEGKVFLKLIDENNSDVKQVEWKHYGKKDKLLNTADLPAGSYSYELEFMGQKQQGYIEKIK